MILKPIWDYLENTIFPLDSTPALFNQYKDLNPKFDLPSAAEIRRNNLLKYLECFKETPRVLVVAEAPGPWGARFSGVPLTTEEQICSDGFPFKGKQSSNGNKPHPQGIFTHAQTAKVFWAVMERFHPKFLAWDAIPFHPHMEGNNALSIRNPTKSELRKFSGLLLNVCSVIDPKVAIAVGKNALKALEIAGISKKHYVRHPVRGGAIQFKNQITKILADTLQ